MIKSVAAAMLGAMIAVLPASAQAPNVDVELRPDYRAGEHYTTVVRGGITEELYTSQEAIRAAEAGAPFPDGTVIIMDDFRNDALFRILVMEKRAEWADVSQSGDWLFRVFASDGTPDMSEDGTSCQSCHASRAADDFVFTRSKMVAD